MICNHFAAKSEIPKPLYELYGLLQKGVCCFPPPKEDNKADKMKDTVVENFDIKKSADGESGKNITLQKQMCFLPKTICFVSSQAQ